MHESPNHAITCLNGGKYGAEKGHDFPPHRHPVWELVYYRSGRILAPVGDIVYETQPGMLVITPPRTVHAEIALTDYSNYYVAVEAPRDIGWPTVIYDDASLGLQSLFSALTRELNARRADSEALLALYAAQLDLLLRRADAYSSASAGERLVTRAELIIEERFNTSLRMGDVADELGCSASGMRAHFANLRATTPREYLRAVRLRHALGMIRGSDQAFETVAQLCGYDSASHLSRHIKKAAGQSPGSVRRTAQQSGDCSNP